MSCPAGYGGGASSHGVTLPPGHPPLPTPPPLKTYTLETLKEARPKNFTATATDSSNGPSTPSTQDDVPLLVGVKGCIFDVSKDSRFHVGGEWRDGVGMDLTRTLAHAAFTNRNQASVTFPLYLENCHQGSSALAGLNFDQLRDLESWYAYFQQHFTLVGRLLTPHEIAEQKTAVSVDEKLIYPGEANLPPMPSDIYQSFLPLIPADPKSKKDLHAILDADDQEAAWSGSKLAYRTKGLVLCHNFIFRLFLCSAFVWCSIFCSFSISALFFPPHLPPLL